MSYHPDFPRVYGESCDTGSTVPLLPAPKLTQAPRPIPREVTSAEHRPRTETNADIIERLERENGQLRDRLKRSEFREVQLTIRVAHYESNYVPRQVRGLVEPRRAVESR